MSRSDVRITQPSYTAGELSDDIYGRKDLAKRQTGLRVLENAFVLVTGGISNRAGLRFATEVKDSTKECRLMVFEAADDDAYCLEVGDEYIRPIFQGAYIDDGGSPYEIVTPYQEAEIGDIYSDQSNDVATFVHPLYAVRELSRVSATNWPFTTVSFQPGIAAPTGVGAVATYSFAPDPATGNNQTTQHKYKVAAISDAGEESLPSGVATAGNNVLGYERNWNTITWSAVAGAVEYVVYKAKNDLYGFVGRTPTLTFKDDNILPLFADSPQSGNNPFNSAGNYPKLVSFAQQRRVFASTTNNPQTIWMTQSGNFKNLGVSSPAKDDDAVEFTLAANRKQDIFHILSVEQGLVVFTRSGIWRVGGRDGDVITPSSILPKPQSSVSPSEKLRPFFANEQMIFASKDRRSVFDLEYSLEKDRFVTNDLTLLAKHLFRNRSIKSWAYAENPYGMFWCVMDDGSLISLTYLKQHEVWGWGRHNTKGKFLDVVSVPEKGIDTPYFMIRRRIGGSWKKFIEFMGPRDFASIEECFFVDSGLSLNNPVEVTVIAPGAQTTLTSPAHGLVDGDEIRLYGAVMTDADDVQSEPLDGRYYVTAATTNTFEIQTSDDEGDTVADNDTLNLVGFNYDGEAVFRKCFQTISGLDHLEGRNVVALADGNVIEALTVSAGQVELDRKYALVHVGLPYESKMQTLDLLNLQGDDTGKTKATPRLFIRVKDSRGVQFGETEADAYEVEPRQFEDYGEAASLKNGLIDVASDGAWSLDNGIWCIQRYPLPMTILGTTSEQNYGG